MHLISIFSITLCCLYVESVKSWSSSLLLPKTINKSDLDLPKQVDNNDTVSSSPFHEHHEHANNQNDTNEMMSSIYCRRNALQKAFFFASLSLLPEKSEALDATPTNKDDDVTTTITTITTPTKNANRRTRSTATAEITDQIFIHVKGLPGTDAPQRIVIGLFGKEAPSCVSKIKALVSSSGLPAPCRPRPERTLQKEQLEANKVYNTCIEGEEQGVSLQYSQIWRVVRDERIDMGAVSGKFVAREFPDWQEENLSNGALLGHDAPGVVSVRRGNEGGFGFTVYPADGSVPTYLDDEHIVIGRVLEGMEAVQALNQVPVVQSSKVNYMALTGGTTTKNAPTRACRYGGPMYCNEFKPLVKLSITQAGLLTNTN